MAQNRPNKPSVTLPDNFGGVKNEFSSTRISTGYESSIPEIVEGGNLNYMLDGLFQNTKYMRTVLDYVRDTPVGKMFWVNSNGQMDYVQPSIIATDTEFNTGTATDRTPNVKQVVDKFATKSDDNAVVHLNGNETITGDKRFQNQSITQSTTDTAVGSYVDFVQYINGARRGTIRTMYDSEGSYNTLFGSNGPDGAAPVGLTVKRTATETLVQVPYPHATTQTGDNAYGNEAVSARWVNSLGNGVVHLGGTETITGSKTFSSATYGTASDASNSVVTTINKNKAQNGYFKFGNGLIIQWGRVTGITTNKESTVTFPTAFTSATSYTIVKNYQSNAQTEAADREVSFYSMTATSAKTFTASTDTNSFSWLAIGY